MLAYRDTDRFVTARTGLIPLSVSADRLAHPAMRCAVIQPRSPGPRTAGTGRQRPAGRGLPGGVPEVLGHAGPRLQRTRRRGNAAPRRAAGRAHAGGPWLDLAGHDEQLAGSDDLFDALIASLTARAVALGSTLRPDAGHARAARTEGWIHLPVGGWMPSPGPRP